MSIIIGVKIVILSIIIDKIGVFLPVIIDVGVFEVVLKVLHLFQMRVLEQMEERMKRICAREEVMGC